MEIKGTSVKTTYDFVKSKYPNDLTKWLQALSPSQKKIFTDVIKANEWYPLMDSVIIPMQVVAKLFYAGDQKKAAREIGIFSAKSALTGIYKAFLLVASVKYVLERARHIWSAYYRPCEFNMLESKSNRAVFEINGFAKEESLIFQRLGGWMEGVFELTKQKSNNVNINIVYNTDSITAKVTAEWS